MTGAATAHRLLVLIVTSHHSDQILELLQDVTEPTEILIAQAPTPRAVHAVPYFMENVAANPNITVLDVIPVSRKASRPIGRTVKLVKRNVLNPRGRTWRADTFVTAYPYSPTSLLLAATFGARQIIAIDDGLSAPMFTGLDRRLEKRLQQVQIPQPIDTPEPYVAIDKPTPRSRLRGAYRTANHAASKALLTEHSPFSVTFVSDYPLQMRPSWRLKRRPQESLPVTGTGDWVLVIGAPFEAHHGSRNSAFLRDGMLQDARMRYPGHRLVYRPHPLEDGAVVQALGDGNADLTIVTASTDWRDTLSEMQSIPDATFSSNSTLAYLLAAGSGCTINTHLSRVTFPPGNPEAWSYLVKIFLALYAENYAWVGTQADPHSFQILGADEPPTK